MRIFKFGISKDPSTYYFENPDFAQVLRRFTQLQSLALDTKYFAEPEGLLKWGDIPHPIQNSILFLIRLPTLTTLTLQYQIFPLSQVAIAANLRYLHIDEVSIFEDENGSINLPGGVQPIFLHEYSMGHSCASTTTAILNVTDNHHVMFDFSELLHLRAELYFPNDSDAAQDVISRTTQLKTLSLISEVPLSHPSVLQGVNISHHSSHQLHLSSTLQKSCPIAQFTHADLNTSSLLLWNTSQYYTALRALHWVRGDTAFPQCSGRNCSHGAILLRGPLSTRV